MRLSLRLAVMLSVVALAARVHGQCNPTTTSTSTSTTTTTVPGNCGNGVIDPGEECEGTFCDAVYDGQPVQSYCGSPGGINACKCADLQCGSGGCGAMCFPSEQCFSQPGCPDPFGVTGDCVPTTCIIQADCGGIQDCENGSCCVTSGNICGIQGFFQYACCGGLTCRVVPPNGFMYCQ